jgi:hypothetical protein
MAQSRKCKQCKVAMAKGERLMEHWQHHHPNELVAIKQWLGDEDYKVRSYEKLAQEGMEGTGSDDPSVVGHKWNRGQGTI